MSGGGNLEWPFTMTTPTVTEADFERPYRPG